jgi:hypothetical protein
VMQDLHALRLGPLNHVWPVVLRREVPATLG